MLALTRSPATVRTFPAVDVAGPHQLELGCKATRPIDQAFLLLLGVRAFFFCI